MTTEEIDLVVGALDSLGCIAADHKHQWSDGEKAIYEESIKVLWDEWNKVKNAPRQGSPAPTEPQSDDPYT